jgi:hypothetical protein
VSSACQPVLLAGNLGGPFYLTLDATTVYWTERGNAFPMSNAVRSIDKDGKNLTTLASAPSRYGAIALDATAVYWSSQRLGAPLGIAAEKAPLGAPSTPSVVTHLDGTFVASGLTLDATNVYFGTGSEVIGAQKTSIDGPPADVVGGLASVGALVNDRTTLFAADTKGVFTTAATLPTFAGAGTLLAGTSSGAIDLVLAGGRLYGAGGANVWSVPSAGGTAIVYSTTESGATGIAVDTSRVYWTTTTDLRTAPIAGSGAVAILAKGYAQLGHVAVDASAIYYADFSGNRIWKLAK